MHNNDFDELAGRIQALADILCGLIADLDKCRVIESPRIANNIRSLADNRQAPGYQESARKTMHHLAKLIEGEHKSRQ
jgi:hypothetical protein